MFLFSILYAIVATRATRCIRTYLHVCFYFVANGRLAQLARAPPLHGGCRGFESLIAHFVMSQRVCPHIPLRFFYFLSHVSAHMSVFTFISNDKLSSFLIVFDSFYRLPETVKNTKSTLLSNEAYFLDCIVALQVGNERTLRPEPIVFNAVYASSSVLTRTTRNPCGTCPTTSSQLSWGAKNQVAPSR